MINFKKLFNMETVIKETFDITHLIELKEEISDDKEVFGVDGISYLIMCIEKQMLEIALEECRKKMLLEAY